MGIYEGVFVICIYTCLLTEGIVYLGCYLDDANRVLPTRQPDSHKNTPAECAGRCSAYRYAGVEYAVQCFCGNSLNASQMPPSDCNKNCPGDKSKICGGTWRISVFTNWVTACGPPPEIANGNATLRKGSNFSYGSIADVYCDPGFVGKPTITCLSNASWEKATCEQPETTTTGPSTSVFESSTDYTTSTSDTSGPAFEESSRGSSAAATAAGVSVAVALAVAAVVIVLILRKKGKLCFAIKTSSEEENVNDNRHISLTSKESKPNADFQIPGAPLSNHTYSGLQNTGPKDTDGYYAIEDNKTSSVPADVHAYFVLEKKQKAIGNENGVSMNEMHPYFVLEKQGGQPDHVMPSNECNSYFVLEKQTTSDETPINAANALELDNDDVYMYQEINSDETYAGVDDSREGNNHYDYTNKAFKDSKTQISDNVYNHLNSAGDEYDHVSKGHINVRAMENNYDVTSGAL